VKMMMKIDVSGCGTDSRFGGRTSELCELLRRACVQCSQLLTLSSHALCLSVCLSVSLLIRRHFLMFGKLIFEIVYIFRVSTVLIVVIM